MPDDEQLKIAKALIASLMRLWEGKHVFGRSPAVTSPAAPLVEDTHAPDSLDGSAVVFAPGEIKPSDLPKSQVPATPGWYLAQAKRFTDLAAMAVTPAVRTRLMDIVREYEILAQSVQNASERPPPKKRK